MRSFSLLYTLLRTLPLIPSIQALSVKRDHPGSLHTVENIHFEPALTADDVPSHIDVSFSLRGEQSRRIKLKLERNDEIFAQSLVINRIHADGSLRSTETIPKGSHLAFRGATFDGQQRDTGDNGYQQEAGWARMTFHFKNGVPLGEGAFSINGEEYHVQTDYNYRRSLDPSHNELSTSEEPYMVAWKEYSAGKRQEANETGCSYGSLDLNMAQINPSYSASLESTSLERRQRGGDDSPDLEDIIGGDGACSTDRLIALIGVVTDCTYTQGFSSEADLRQHVISQVNTASQLYEDSMNISLRVRNLTISDADCPSTASSSTPWNHECDTSINMGSRLDEFSQWRTSISDNENAAWMLLSACNTGATVGIAWMGTVCNMANSRRSTPSTSVVIRTGAEWQVMAHEIAHTFGAVHDCASGCTASGLDAGGDRCCPLNDNTCNAGGDYIMNPSTSSRLTQFSRCTIGTICTAMQRNLISTACLSGNEDVTTVSDGECGNGIVEDGEECDCGGEEGCGNNPCCNPQTCQFVGDAVCDPTNDGCCTDQCGLAARDTTCRASTSLCDPAETCNGESAACPSNVVLDDGESCGNDSDGLTCASGECTSRQRQCSMALSGSQNLTSALPCSNSTCSLDCYNSDQGTLSNQCPASSSSSSFIDGTPCGNGLFCRSGSCSRSPTNGGDNDSGSGSWIDRNRTIFIVICVVGGLIVLAVLFCIATAVYRRAKRPSPITRNVLRASHMQRPPMAQQQQFGQMPRPPEYTLYVPRQSQRYA